jgi:hypothetical protein
MVAPALGEILIENANGLKPRFGAPTLRPGFERG